MTDQAQRTEWAVQQFVAFIEGWTPPAALPYAQADIIHVRNAITTIAPPMATKLVGYAVFAQRPDREYDSGFGHIAISAVFDELGQAQNAYDYAKSRGETQEGFKYFTICAVQQIPT